MWQKLRFWKYLMSAVKKPFATPCNECTFALVNVGSVFILCQYVDLTHELLLSIDKTKWSSLAMNCLVYSLGLAESGKSLHFTISRFPHQTESGFVKMSLHCIKVKFEKTTFKSDSRKILCQKSLENKLQLQIQNKACTRPKKLCEFCEEE